MIELPPELTAALGDLGDEEDWPRLRRATRDLIDRYREDRPAARPILADGASAVVYALYRMPATYSAVRRALASTELPDGESIRSHLDLGGGTGAAVWAAADRWPHLSAHTVVDFSPAALELGARLAKKAHSASIRNTFWREEPLTPSGTLPSADLITMSYVLGELEWSTAVDLLRWTATTLTAKVVVVVEPGTVAGYNRICAARRELIASGLTIAAPCPQDGRCPLDGSEDWCHFAVRLARQKKHRDLKGGTEQFEDEKFSYVVAVRAPAARATYRILRHPTHRRGCVDLKLCTPDCRVEQRTVSRRDTQFRLARRAEWGDPWPPDALSPVPVPPSS